jgi:hypothetical protein
LKRDLFGVGSQQPTQGRRVLLWFCLVALIGVMLFTHSTAFGRYEARRSYQESPLSPLATPLTATLSVTAPVTAAAVSPVNTAVGVTAVLTSAITSPLLVTTTEVITAPAAQPAPTVVEPLVATPGVGNQGQVSLLLVGGVLASILVVIVVVLSRRQRD